MAVPYPRHHSKTRWVLAVGMILGILYIFASTATTGSSDDEASGKSFVGSTGQISSPAPPPPLATMDAAQHQKQRKQLEEELLILSQQQLQNNGNNNSPNDPLESETQQQSAKRSGDSDVTSAPFAPEEERRGGQQQGHHHHQQQQPYHDWVVAVMVKNFGRAITEAAYDPNLYHSMLTTITRGGGDDTNDNGLPSWPNDDVFEFTAEQLRLPPSSPTHFHNISNVLWWTKRWITMAISKITRDSELEKLFRLVSASSSSPSQSSSLKLNLFEAVVVRALGAQVQYFHTVLQLAVDATLTWRQKLNIRSAMRDSAADVGGSDATVDPLILISGWLTPATTIAEIDVLFRIGDNQSTTMNTSDTAADINNDTALKNVLRKRLLTLVASTGKHQPHRDAQSIFPINYQDVAYGKSRPINGKFWNMVRPTAGCSSIVRLCEIPDGCRLVCNAEYLLYAGRKSSRQHGGDASSTDASSGRHPTRYQHRIIGMGCNNQFDWELSLLSLFESASSASRNTTHRIGWMTSMDCTITLAPGLRQWRVPQALREAAVGYSGVSLCAGDRKSSPTLLTPSDLKAFQTRTEATWDQPAAADQPLVRYTAHPDAIAASHLQQHQLFTMRPADLSSPAAASASPSPRWFDDVTILKIDVEGFEWQYIPAWLRGEFRSVAAHTSSTKMAATDSIDFATAAPEYFTVSLFSLEFHRIGFRNLLGASAAGALRMHWLSLQIHALGFIMVAHEKNEYSQCCFEYTYAHVRHFIKSELWMTLRDEL